MSRFHAIGSMVAGWALVSGAIFAVEPGELKKFGWHGDYAAGRAEAKRTHKPLMLVFRCEP